MAKQRFHRAIRQLALAALMLGAAPAVAQEGLASSGSEDGFLEPYQSVEVAASEAGVVRDVKIREGDAVSAGQVLGLLHDEDLVAALNVARAEKDARGSLRAAEAELRHHEELVGKLKELRERRHASPEEVERAVLQREVAAARLEAAREQIDIRRLEYERIEARLAYRRITSPINGVALRIHKKAGEFVAPTDPVLVTVVQLDPLLAVLSVPAPLLAELAVGEQARLRMADGRVAIGTVEYIAPVTDSQSGTTRIKVRVPNGDRRWRSGEKCTLVPDRVRRPAGGGQAERRLPRGLRFSHAPSREQR